MNNTLPLDIEFLINNGEVDRQAQRVRAALRGVNQDAQQQAQQTASSVESFAKRASLAAASFLSIQAAGNFVRSMVEVRGEFQQIEVAYKTMLGSKEKADQLMAESVALAAKTPFSLQEVANGSKQLMAYGFQAKDLTKTIEMLGNVASGVGAPLNDIVYLYGTLQTQGRAYQKDIMQFTGRGIPIVAELAKQFGVTEGQVNKLVEAGKVGFPEVEKAFQSLTGSSGIFYNLMQEQSKTLTGQLSNLGDAWSRMLNDLGKANQGVFADGITAAISLVNNYQEVIDIIEGLITVYGVYKGVQLANIAITKMQAFVTANYSLEMGLLRAAFALQATAQTFLNSSMVQGAVVTAGVTIALTTLIFTVKALVDEYNHMHLAESQLNDIRGEAVKNLQDQKLAVDELVRVATNENSTLEEKQAAIKKLNDISPDYLGALNAQNIATKEGTDAIRHYIDALNDKLLGESAYQQKLENLKKANDIKTRGYDAMGISEEAGAIMQDFFTGGLFKGGDAKKRVIDNYVKDLLNANDAIDKEFAAQLKNRATGGGGKSDTDAQKRARLIAQQLLDPLKNFDALVKEASGKGDLDALQEALQAKLNVLAPNDKQQDVLKARLKAVKKLLDTYSLSADDKANKAGDDAAKRHADLLAKIYQLNEKYAAKAGTEQQQKLMSIRDDYDKLRADIDKYNAEPANKKKIDKAVLKPKELAAVTDQADRNETDYIAGDIDKKKQLYAEYEEYRAKLGDEAAKKEYADLLQSGETYKTYLDNLAASIPAAGLSGALQERRELIVNAVQDEAKVLREKDAGLLYDSQTYQQQRNILLAKYLKEASELRAKGYADQADQALKNGEDELTALDEDNFRKMDAYRDLFDRIDTISTASAKEQIANLYKVAEASFKAGTITKRAYQDIIKGLREAEAKIENKIPEGLKAIGGELTNLGSLAGNFDAGLGKALTTVGNLVSGIGAIKGNLNTINSTSASSFSKITAGLGIVGTAIGIFSTIYSLFDTSKEKAEQEKYNTDLQLKATEAVNKALERQLALTNQLYGPERISGYLKQLNDIAAAQTDLNSKIAGKLTLTGVKVIDENIAKYNAGETYNKLLLTKDLIDRMGIAALHSGQSIDELQKLLDQGKLDSNTAALVQQLIALNDQVVDVQNQLKATLTGTSFDSLLDGIVNLFDSANVKLEDFANNFQKIIQQDILNSFKRDFLGKQLQGFYDDLAAATKKSGTLTKDDIASLQAEYNKIIGDAYSQFKNIQASTGLVFGDPAADVSDNSLAGAIKGITADQADLLAGQFGGLRLTQLQTNVLLGTTNQSIQAQTAEMRTQTLLQKEIAANMLRTADNTDEMVDSLRSIDKKVSANANALAGNGRIP